MTRRHVLRHVDYVLLAAVAGAVAFSLVTIRSAASTIVLERQALYVCVGVTLGAVAAAIDLRRMRGATWGLYAAVCALLVVVLAIGQAARGAARWIPLPGFQLQPSEIGKIGLAIVLAAYVARRRNAVRRVSW